VTDSRLPEHWLNLPQYDELSDRAWRAYCGSLMWSNSAGTDGKLTERALRLIHPAGTIDSEVVRELVDGGWWTEQDNKYAVANWSKSQVLAADVEHQRERNRRNQAAARARVRGAVTRDITADVSSDIPRDNSGEISGHAGGQERRGEASTEGELSVTSVGETARESAELTGCYDCQRTSVFNSDAPPCPKHRAQLAG
jgi:hypothetical protein